jgi:hypothetical protein
MTVRIAGKKVIVDMQMRMAAEAAAVSSTAPTPRPIADVHLMTKDQARVEAHKLAAGAATVEAGADSAAAAAAAAAVATSTANVTALLAAAGVTPITDESHARLVASERTPHLLAFVSAASTRSAALLERWPTLTAALSTQGVRAFVVDGTQAAVLKRKYGVTGYPALVSVSANGVATLFSGARTGAYMLAWMR